MSMERRPAVSSGAPISSSERELDEADKGSNIQGPHKSGNPNKTGNPNKDGGSYNSARRSGGSD